MPGAAVAPRGHCAPRVLLRGAGSCGWQHGQAAACRRAAAAWPQPALAPGPLPTPRAPAPAQFCLAYKRTTEFRRLCDIVRNHLTNLLKYRDQGGRDRTDLK